MGGPDRDEQVERPEVEGLLVTWLAVTPVPLLLPSAIRAALPDLRSIMQTALSSILPTGTPTWPLLPVVQRRARLCMLRDAAGKLQR